MNGEYMSEILLLYSKERFSDFATGNNICFLVINNHFGFLTDILPYTGAYANLLFTGL
jgi:hypothetical protein